MNHDTMPAQGPVDANVRGVTMQIIHIAFAGPERMILDSNRRKWKFEDHHYCGPIVLGKDGDPLDVQPQENSPFWSAVNLWYAQGKRTKDPRAGEIWCVWDKPTMRKMRHIGGNHYELVTDEQASNA